jgi:hypothetical protein
MAQASEQGSGSVSKTARRIEAELDSLERLVRGAPHGLDNLTKVIRTSVDTLRGLPDEAPGHGDTFVDREIVESGNHSEGIESAEFLKKPFGVADIRTWATNQLSLEPHAPGAGSL